jgi:hypothetical protein
MVRWWTGQLRGHYAQLLEGGHPEISVGVGGNGVRHSRDFTFSLFFTNTSHGVQFQKVKKVKMVETPNPW